MRWSYSLYAKGPDHGRESPHFAEIYGASVSKETISRIIDKVIERPGCQARPLDAVHAAIFIDALVRHEALYYRVEVRPVPPGRRSGRAEAGGSPECATRRWCFGWRCKTAIALPS